MSQVNITLWALSENETGREREGEGGEVVVMVGGG